MEFDDREVFTRKCYNCEQPVLDNIKIVYNPSNSKIILWNKYQVFVYEGIEFESFEITFVPEFHIQLVIASNNFLVYLDFNGNVHISSLKFKNSAQKSIKIPFQPREDGVKICIRYKEDRVLSLKHDAGTYFLCLHKISSEFQLVKSFILLCNTENWRVEQSSKEKYLLSSYTINKENLEDLNKLYNSELSTINMTDLVLLSFDNLTVYSCLISPKMVEDELTLVKLYCCPADISCIEVIDRQDLSLLIGLTMGTLIKLYLNDISKPPVIVHLNTALYKMLAFKDSLIYSDGVTMWKSENTFTTDVKITEFFIRNTNDFVKCGDQIVCTTFNKLIYTFSIEDKNAYVIPISSDEYCPAEKLLNNSDYLNKIFEEIDKNNEQVNKLSIEQDYITALSLSNRQDVVEKAIESSVTVFESYDEISDMEFSLTEEIKEYFEADTLLFLVKITNFNIYNTLNNILSNLLDNVRIHITILSQHKILKSTSLITEKPLKSVKFLIPLNVKNATEINVNIKIVVNIPNALDKKQTWSVLYRKDIILSSEHFIKTQDKIKNNSLKKPKENIEYLIQKTALIQHGGIFKFTDLSTLNESNEYSFYVMLPNDFKTIFKTGNYCNKYINSNKCNSLIQQWNAKEFLDSKSHLTLEIGNEKVKLKIHNDSFSNPVLRVSGNNPQMVFNVRNFFSNMIYDDYESHAPGKEFIKYSFYTATENLQKAVKNCIKSSATFEEFSLLMEQFEKNIIGSLPL